MSISKFFNETAIYEKYTSTVDTFGQSVKTWSVSTFFTGCWQGRSGSHGLFDTQEKADRVEKFYCSADVNILSTGRLVFSTSAFIYSGNSSGTSSLSSSAGYLYFVSADFSTFVYGDYIITTASSYEKESMTYREIEYVNDKLRSNHIQVDLRIDNASRS